MCPENCLSHALIFKNYTSGLCLYVTKESSHLVLFGITSLVKTVTAIYSQSDPYNRIGGRTRFMDLCI